MTTESEKRSDSEAEIWEAIAAFEKILEAIPNDHISLETLADAYEKVGDRTRAQDYLVRLANVVIDEGDEDAAHDLLRKLKSYDRQDTQIQATIQRIESMEPEKVRALILDTPEPTARRSRNIAAEISFAWNLLQGKKLTQEEYANVVHDLSENSAKSADMTISTLHVLNDRNFPGLGDILVFAANACNTPIISLSSFELQLEAVKQLPLEFIIQRGALPFEIMGQDALVAILNPYDEQLTIDIEDTAGKPCYCYMVTPHDFDNTLDKVKHMLKESG